ncbi:hypothetical protein C8J23_11374 [Shewanella chilikensis]|uniref:DUF7079 domain-containing protein n=1 Tax=Shewanella chilikensis TaxID=558541 RepID=A0ABX5PNV9_9GAMM|nr:hypothetical protein [Shewanella chilikensis]MCL1154524.1 hypothetical protein [Shewanella chilikensis]PYE58579.1 hypothetical protein C8J23_11374 [Shewanella chilikensis]GGZ31055.1 hypothetical protein GCM10007105_18040 [Shewanella chilikensis]
MAESPSHIMLEETVKFPIRQAVWSALSDLFLDTDVTLHYPGIIRVCALSPYSLKELEHILYREVAPVCGPNLFDVCGEWAGFDEQWLKEQILLQLINSPNLWQRMKQHLAERMFNDYLAPHWQLLSAQIHSRRNNTLADKL